MKNPVVSRKNLPVRMPWMQQALLYLLLKSFAASGWVWGVVGTLVAILWVAWAVGRYMEDERDIFEGKKL